jgi:NitT/TauT family transport system ATP-binding protein
LRLDNDLRKLWLESQMTVLFVTHSISEAAFLSDRILMLSRKTGNIQFAIKNPLVHQRGLEVRSDKNFGELTHDLFEKFQELE